MNALPVIQSPVSSPAEKPISLGDVDDCRFVLVTGGVISGVGKGIVASSTGVLLKSLGLRVTSIKIDPYLNIDAGTLSPFDHGEVFVLDDGGEVDLDLGNYERFLDITLTKEHNITTGKIYQQVIEKERRGDYLGKTVQVVPHVTNCIQDWILRVSRIPVDSKLVGSGEGGDSASRPQVCIIELGGTVGEIETGPFVEALRQLQFRVGRDRFLCVHVALVPETGDGEQKSKPMQHSVRDLRGLGLTPDLIAFRSARPLDPTVRDKISLFCQVPPESVVAVHDCESTYHVPPLLESQGYLRFMHERLQLGQLAGPYGSLTDPARNAYWLQWQSWLAKWTDAKSSGRSVTVGVVGKYTNLPDAYISIARAIVHAGTTLGHSCRIVWIEASHLEEHADDSSPDAADNAAWKTLKACDALVIAGGFGERGTQGKIMACRHARLQMQPLLGICLGFQLSVVEWARDVLGWRDAHSTEMDPKTGHPVVVFMPEVSKTHMGGTMRLGVRRTLIDRRAGGTNASEAHAPEANESKANASKANASEAMASRIDELYGGTGYADERHRHRYEVNPSMAGQLEAAKCPQTGQQMRFVGKDDTGERMEILAIAPHPFFVGVQYHPEYKSRTLAPSPVFLGLLQAAIVRKSAAQ